MPYPRLTLAEEEKSHFGKSPRVAAVATSARVKPQRSRSIYSEL